MTKKRGNKMRKILILGMILCSLLAVTINSVSAIEETQTVTDNTNDVIDLYAESEDDIYVTNKPNIDVTKLEYNRKDGSATVEITVKGEIEDRGDIDVIFEDYEDATINYVAYKFIVSNESYLDTGYHIYYDNKECKIEYYPPYDSDDEVQIINLTEDQFDAQGDTLTVTFDLINPDETFDYIMADTEDVKLVLLTGSAYLDLAPDEEFIDDEPNGENGDDNSGQNGGLSDSAFLLFVGLFAVIVVAGIIILIVIIRR